MPNKSGDSHHSHDHIVKKLLSGVDVARDVLNIYLPKEILSRVDLTILELQNSSFIDDRHRAFAADILYKTKLKSGADSYIYILIEHQSKSDPWMPVRLFKYMGLIWDQARKKASGKYHVPLVFPLVIYNGKRPYNHSLNLIDLLATQEEKAIFSNLFNKPFFWWI